MPDADCRIHADIDIDILGKILFDLLDPSVDLVDDRYAVGSRLRHHHYRHHRLSVALQDVVAILRLKRCRAHLAQTHIPSPGRFDDDVVELLDFGHLSHRLDGQFGRIPLDLSGGKLDILALQRRAHIECRQVVRGQAGGIEPEAHRISFLSPDIDLADARNVLKHLLEPVVGDPVDVEKITRLAGDGDHQDRGGVGVGFGDGRRIGIGGQVALGAGGAVTHIVCRCFQVDAELELHGDLAAPLAADRGQRAQSGYTIDRGLERLGDLRFDNVGIGARISSAHGDDRRIDRRILANSQLGESIGAEQDDHDRHHDRQHRPLYADC